MQCFPGPQAEARVVPWASHGVVDDEALRQWAAVMRTRGADREELIAAACEQNRFVADMAGEHVAVGQLLDCDAQCQVGTRGSRLGFFHCDLPVRSGRRIYRPQTPAPRARV